MNVVCSICTINLSESSDLRVTKCGHLYHHDCISKWLAKSQSCPECRSNCSAKALIRLYLNVDQEQNERDVRVQRLVGQLENELNVKLSVSALASGSSAPVKSSPVMSTSVALQPPARPPLQEILTNGVPVATVPLVAPVRVAAPATVASIPVEEVINSTVQAALTTLQLPKTLQESVLCLRQATAKLAQLSLQSPAPVAVVPKSVVAPTPVAAPRNVAAVSAEPSTSRVCKHLDNARMFCVDHRTCVDDCRSPMFGIWLMHFHESGENGCWYCVECAQLKCAYCRTDLFDTCVRYKRKVYHEACFPCQKCGLTLESRVTNLMRPSQHFHTECLNCEWCYQNLRGSLYCFRNDLPICQNCNSYR